MRVTVCIVVLFAALTGLAAKSAITKIPVSDIGKKVVIIGELGHPLGEVITIKGFKWSRLTGTEFEVEAVNGEKRKWGFIEVPGIRSWKDETDATLRGIEVALIKIYTKGESNIGPEEKFIPRQMAFRSFRVDEIIAPANLKLDK